MEVAACRLIPSSNNTSEQQACWLPPRKKPVPLKTVLILKTKSIIIKVIDVIPYFMLVVSLIELSVLVAGSANARVGEVLQAALVFDPRRRGEVWRFVSYMLLHAGAAHAALNLGIQLLLAAPLECEQGRRRTALIYLGGGLAGSLSTSVFEPDLFLVGASGGVYALLTSQLANIVLNFPGVRYRLQRAIAVCVLSLADVLFSLYHHFLLGNRCPRVGWAAHTGGALVGLLLGLLLFRAPPPQIVMGRALPQPIPVAPAHKPRRAAMLTAVRCIAAASLAGALAAAIALNLMRPPSN